MELAAMSGRSSADDHEGATLAGVGLRDRWMKQNGSRERQHRAGRNPMLRPIRKTGHRAGMDAKDWIAGASLLVSLGALGVAVYALRLTLARDRRDIEAKSPVIDITLPTCLGSGPWKATCDVTNRSTETIVLEAILARMVSAMVIHVTADVEKMDQISRNGRDKIVLAGPRINREIKPGETITESFAIRLYGSQKQLPGPTPMTFYVDLRAKNEAQTRIRRTIARTATI